MPPSASLHGGIDALLQNYGKVAGLHHRLIADERLADADRRKNNTNNVVSLKKN